MAGTYRIIGAEESPDSVMVRAYLTFKGLPYRWLTRTDAAELYAAHATTPAVPMVVTAQGEAFQTPAAIVDHLDREHPHPSAVSSDPTVRVVAKLMMAFANTWASRWRDHYRWAREIDQTSFATRLAVTVAPDADSDELAEIAATIRDRMTRNVWFTATTANIAAQIEESFRDCMALLELHLTAHPYLFGGAPAHADFALWAQLESMRRDPTPAEVLRTRAPRTIEWIDRMSAAQIIGEFEPWSQLAPTIGDIVRDQIAGLFLPWAQANADAHASAAATFKVQLRSVAWRQPVNASNARAFVTLRDACNAADTEAQAALQTTGCVAYLKLDQP